MDVVIVEVFMKDDFGNSNMFPLNKHIHNTCMSKILDWRPIFLPRLHPVVETKQDGEGVCRQNFSVVIII